MNNLNEKYKMRSVWKILILAGLAVLLIWRISYYNTFSKKQKDKSRLGVVLQTAGSRKNECEKVIDHFASDSLKSKAARFLIENMLGHFSYKAIDTVPKLVEMSFDKLHHLALKAYFKNQQIRSFQFVDTLQQIYSPDYCTLRTTLLDSIIGFYNLDKAKNLTKDKVTEDFESKVTEIGNDLLAKCTFKKKQYSPVDDMSQINADYLIDHIDNAFRMWKKSPLARNLSFKEFSETILPYRYFYEPLGDVKSSKWNNLFFDVFYPLDSLNIEEINRRFNFYTYALDCFENDGKLLGNYGFYDILQFYQFDCDRHAEWACKALNSCGIPTIMLFRLNRNWNSNHYCIAIRSNSGKYEPFTPKWQSLHDSAYFSMDLKNYQVTYSHQQECPLILKLKDEQIPEIFNTPFLKDISQQFHQVTDLTITSRIPIKGHKLAYLGVFKPGGWRPIAWGIVGNDKHTISFKQIALNAYYIAGIYENNQFVPVSLPFNLNKNKEVEWVLPDSKLTTMPLTRKYPERKEMIERIQKMEGARIQVASKRDFSDQSTILTLKLKDMEQFVVKAMPVNLSKRYRYIRCVPPKDQLLNLATFEVFTQYCKGDSLSTGSAPYILSSFPKDVSSNEKLTQVRLYPLGDDPKLKNLLDGNMETYYKGFSASFDLGKPIEIAQIRFAPRNSNNGIVVGDRYELFYYDNEWKSAGIQKAVYNYLEYKDIPSGTIYWLHNLDHGKEEQVFSYKDGKQVFN